MQPSSLLRRNNRLPLFSQVPFIPESSLLLVVEAFLHSSISSWIVSSEHETLGRRLVFLDQLLIVSGHNLCQEHPASARRVVDVAAMQQQVAEDDGLASLCHHGRGAFDGILGRIRPMVSVTVFHDAVVLEHAQLVGAGVDAEAAVLGVRVVQVEEHGHHGVVLVGEVEVVLVQQVRGALLRRLDVGLGVVQGNVLRPHDVLQRVQQPVVQQHLGEDRRVHLEVVHRQNRVVAALGGLLHVVTDPRRLHALALLPLEQVVVFLGDDFHLLVREKAELDVAILLVEVDVFLAEEQRHGWCCSREDGVAYGAGGGLVMRDRKSVV